MPGRYQLGEEVPLKLLCVNGAGAPVAPDAAPTVDIWRGATKVLAGAMLPTLDRAAATGLFRLGVFLGGAFSEGRHTAVFRYRAGSYYGQAVEDFEVVPGGSRDGAVVAVHWYERPHAGFVVQQLDSGKLTRGRNPRV
jgi:hypothetical protein